MAYDVSDFQKEVIERSRKIPVLVDFWAEWCGPCKVLGPVLERLADQSDGRWALAKLDTEAHTDIASQYEIQSIPNVKLFVDGEVVDEFVGALPEFQVRRWLQSAIPGKYEKQLKEAETFLAAGNHAATEALLGPVISDEPGNARARVLMAWSVAFSDPSRAASYIENIDDPRYSDILEAVRTFARLYDLAQHLDQLPAGGANEIYRSALQALVAHDFDAAIGHFIEVIRQDRYYDDDGPRKACIAIFKILGEQHSLTQKYRREFSSALY